MSGKEGAKGVVRPNKGLIFTGVFLLLGMCLLSWVFWCQFWDHWRFWKFQRPALCMDGRTANCTKYPNLCPVNQTYNQTVVDTPRYIVDDTKGHKRWFKDQGYITMRCGIPVALYPCQNTGAAKADGSDCKPGPVQKNWPTRTTDAGIHCIKPGSESESYNHCDQKDWVCQNLGPCDAYEKTRRQCGRELSTSPYLCYHAVDHAKLGVRLKGVHDLQVWVSGILLVLFMIVLPIFYLVVLCKWDKKIEKKVHHHDPAKRMTRQQALNKKECCGIDFKTGCANWCQIVVICAIILSIVIWLVLLVRHANGADSDERIKGSQWLTLQLDMFPNNVLFPGAHGNYTVVPEDPIRQLSMAWWHWLLIILGSMCGVFCFTFGVMMWCGGECNKHDEYRGADDDMGSGSESESGSD